MSATLVVAIALAAFLVIVKVVDEARTGGPRRGSRGDADAWSGSDGGWSGGDGGDGGGGHNGGD